MQRPFASSHDKPLRRMPIVQVVGRHPIAHGGEQVGDKTLLTHLDMQVLNQLEMAQNADKYQRNDACDAHAHQQVRHPCAIGQQTQHRHPEHEEYSIGGHQQRCQRGRQEVGHAGDKSVGCILVEWHLGWW